MNRKSTAVVERLSLAPKPVHPSSIITHGMFNVTHLRQHMIADPQWTPVSLTEQFRIVANLLGKRMSFKRLEDKSQRDKCRKQFDRLRHHCRDGYNKLKYILHEESTSQVRHTLIHNKEMQRLYSKMPLHIVDDKIDQRTFSLRKERDRLQHRLGQMQNRYKEIILQYSELENRIKYQNEFELESEGKAREFHKEIKNSHIRLQSIKTINSTYKKIIQVLQHDATFYDPILVSLNKDIEDQGKFIEYVQFMGTPAIIRMKELGDDFKKIDDNDRKINQERLHIMNKYRKDLQRRTISAAKMHKTDAEIQKDNKIKTRRYERETLSMQFLKNQLIQLETTMKSVKFVTLCSNAKEMYPRMKSQAENNLKLRKLLEKDQLGYLNIRNKLRRGQVLSGVLINNLTEEEIIRLERTRLLNKALNIEDLRTTSMLKFMSNRGKALVLLRYSLWNMNEILKYVERPPRVYHVSYPNSYLKLPLLKFDNMTMRACPPEQYEQNVDSIMRTVKHKIALLAKAFKGQFTPDQVAKYSAIYSDMFVDTLDAEEVDSMTTKRVAESIDIDDIQLEGGQGTHDVPNRRQLKLDSARIYEDAKHKEDN